MRPPSVSSQIIRFKLQNVTFQTVKQSVAGVRVLYNEMKEIIITEEKKSDFNDLISSVGGTLGLFLGISFLSMIEFVEIVMQSFLIYFAKTQHHSAKVVDAAKKAHK
jgi:hypothetical protein